MVDSCYSLHRAVWQSGEDGNEDTVKALLEAGAHVNERDPFTGDFPLLIAVTYKLKFCAQLLLEKRADPNQEHALTGATPLLEALGAVQPQLVIMLLEAGADANQVNILKDFPLRVIVHAIARHPDDQLICVRALLEKGVTFKNLPPALMRMPHVRMLLFS